MKKLFVGLIIIIIGALAGYFAYSYYITTDYYFEKKLETLKYSDEAKQVIKDNDLIKEIINKDLYSKTLETALTSEYFDANNINAYYELKYVEEEDYIYNINTLLKSGYTTDNIKSIYESLNSENIKKTVESNYNSNLLSYLNLSYFRQSNYDRYLNYGKANTNYSNEDIVTYVNIGLDYDYYSHVTNVTNPDEINVLVNKYSKLASNFVPSDLSTIDGKCSTSTLKLKTVARDAFQELCYDAISSGLSVLASSTYRSYNYQLGLYNTYVARDGQSKADTFSAKPGYSEHQTGLAVDVSSGTSNMDDFEKTNEFTWMVNNSYKYGFILRYPENKEHITGYMYESWHYRYVGKEIAEYIYNNNLTYDEYMARQ
ncbi:MAG: M15 family metallopeptidase [bacterium]|nr:M15 family metallopeptidase [bacterium]